MPKVSKQSASHVDDHDRVSGHLLTVLFKNGTRLAGTGSQQGVSLLQNYLSRLG